MHSAVFLTSFLFSPPALQNLSPRELWRVHSITVLCSATIRPLALSVLRRERRRGGSCGWVYVRGGREGEEEAAKRMLRERELQRLMTSSSYAECQMTELRLDFLFMI